MKTFLIFLILTVIFQACGEKNAFSRFKLSQEQELSLNSLQSSKLKNGVEVNGVVSAVYLNDGDPQRFTNGEFFYIFMYVKDKSFPLTFTLNGKKPIYSVKELTCDNEFTQLTAVNTKWNRYFIVTFQQQGDILNFQVTNGQFKSDVLRFEKDE